MAALAMVLLLALLAAYAVIAMFGISPQPLSLGASKGTTHGRFKRYQQIVY
jgi:hypothetical protein